MAKSNYIPREPLGFINMMREMRNLINEPVQSGCKCNTMRLELVCYRQPGLESQIWTELRSGQWTEEEINVQSRA